MSESITNRFEYSLVDSIAMYEWELENLSHDQVTNEKIRNLITNAIRSTRKMLKNHRQYLEKKRQENKLWENLWKAKQEGPRSKIDEAESALTQFLAEQLSKKTGKIYLPDISLSEILSERVRYNQFQGKRHRLFIFIIEAVLLVVSLGCFAFFRRRRRNSDLSCLFVAFMFGNIIPSARAADPTTAETEALVTVYTNKQGQLLYTVTGAAGVYVYEGIRRTNRYKKLLLSVLAFHEKLGGNGS